MARSKHGTALFEVYAKATQLDAGPVEAAPEPPPTKAKPKSVSAFRSTLQSLSRVLASDGASTPTQRRNTVAETSSVAIDEGRLHVTLTSRGAGVALFAALLLLTICFSAGHWMGRSGDGDSDRLAADDGSDMGAVETAMRTEPAADLFDGVGESPVLLSARRPPSRTRIEAPPVVPLAAQGVRERSIEWQRDLTYIVVQNFTGNARQDAVAAQEYLAENDMDTEVIGSPDRGFRLIATRGFDWSNPSERKDCEAFQRKIHNIGRTYYKNGGRYRLQGYVQTLKSESW